MTQNNYRWSLEAMGVAKVPKRNTRFLRDVNLLPDRSNHEYRGIFDLCYFYGDKFNLSNIRRKSILFIPGGPGEIVDRKRRDLKFLEARHNVVYFDIRGSGLSKIPSPNSYDQFLRARYVVEDLESLRRRVLGDHQPWDVIYAHSFGTVIAQQYAYKYGTGKVKRLILSAPIARQKETRQNRRDLTASNFRSIYLNYRDKPCLKYGPVAFQKAPAGRLSISYTNDCCFISRREVSAMYRALSKLLEELEHKYASISFIVENYGDLLQQDKEFRYYYPKEFFSAIRTLQMMGCPPFGNVAAENSIKAQQVNAALLLGYYLSFNRNELNRSGNRALRFKELSQFASRLCPLCRNQFKWRFGVARNFLLKKKLGKKLEQLAGFQLEKDSQIGKSRRAYYTYGVYDGVSRWVFGVLKKRLDRQACFTGSDVQRFANLRIGKNKVARKLAKQIGTDPREDVCPWDPKHYSHNVPSLLIHGGADPITAGGQAEYFFKSGIKNKDQSFLVTIPGMGHGTLSMPIAIINGRKQMPEQTLSTLFEIFVATSSTSALTKNLGIRNIIKALNAETHPLVS